jgi:hypothetical protein
MNSSLQGLEADGKRHDVSDPDPSGPVIGHLTWLS